MKTYLVLRETGVLRPEKREVGYEKPEVTNTYAEAVRLLNYYMRRDLYHNDGRCVLYRKKSGRSYRMFAGDNYYKVRIVNVK